MTVVSKCTTMQIHEKKNCSANNIHFVPTNLSARLAVSERCLSCCLYAISYIHVHTKVQKLSLLLIFGGARQQ